MMEHIQQHDWCTPIDNGYFIEECDLDNSVVNSIILGKFRDPLISSESEDEADIDWDQYFTLKQNAKEFKRTYTPGLHALPPYPKLSALTAQQHIMGLKILSHGNLERMRLKDRENLPSDPYVMFEELKEVYEKEQNEFIEWAKTLWLNEHSARITRSRPIVNAVNEAEFKMRAQRLRAFPKHYKIAAQIELETTGLDCKLAHVQSLITVNVDEMAKVRLPNLEWKTFNIIRQCPVPEPCIQHPCRFVLPYESAVSILPLTELHRELCQFALDEGASVVASESALKCLVECDRSWCLPLSVCTVFDAEGECCNVLALGSHFSAARPPPMERTYGAYRHLLQHALVPPSERDRVFEQKKKATSLKKPTNTKKPTNIKDSTNINPVTIIKSRNSSPSHNSDSEEDLLFIDTDNEDSCNDMSNDKETLWSEEETEDEKEMESRQNDANITKKIIDGNDKVNDNNNEISIYNCTCKGSPFENPPPRSYMKWQIRNKICNKKFDIIVHCSHKTSCESGELLLEPIPEYQMDLGASAQSRDSIRSIALSLLLRRNYASLLNARVDQATGELVIFHKMNSKAFHKENKGAGSEAVNGIFTALDQLQGLIPGNYILQHEPRHGANALLYATGGSGAGAGALTLNLEYESNGGDSLKAVRPRTLIPLLLPSHKHRNILPCAFSPYPEHVNREPRRAVTRLKPPPQAIKWPKKSKKKKRRTTF